ncbi:hypothetical protein WJX72_009666 [[Myrmecia] bisecta]|uniref:Uncharacterized protein n=1 Tax=[Myrmecia] bisecta TaxID=41462 RepID=A0AAW1PT28_9CHLO
MSQHRLPWPGAAAVNPVWSQIARLKGQLQAGHPASAAPFTQPAATSLPAAAQHDDDQQLVQEWQNLQATRQGLLLRKKVLDQLYASTKASWTEMKLRERAIKQQLADAGAVAIAPPSTAAILQAAAVPGCEAAPESTTGQLGGAGHPLGAQIASALDAQQAGLNRSAGRGSSAALGRAPGITIVVASTHAQDAQDRYSFPSLLFEVLSTSEGLLAKVACPDTIATYVGSISGQPAGGSSTPTGLGAKYASPLRVFKSYRLCETFQAVAGVPLISKTYTHRINPQWPLCPYEIRGSCRNASCIYQMAVDYAPDSSAVISDIVDLVRRAGHVVADPTLPQDIMKAGGLQQLSQQLLKGAPPHIILPMLAAPRPHGREAAAYLARHPEDEDAWMCHALEQVGFGAPGWTTGPGSKRLLEVLSKGLEHNQSSAKLWLLYLRCYAQISSSPQKHSAAAGWMARFTEDVYDVLPTDAHAADHPESATPGGPGLTNTSAEDLAAWCRHALLRMLHFHPSAASVLWTCCAHVLAWEALPDRAVHRLGYVQEPFVLQWPAAPSASKAARVTQLLLTASGNGLGCLALQLPLSGQVVTASDVPRAVETLRARQALATTIHLFEQAVRLPIRQGRPPSVPALAAQSKATPFGSLGAGDSEVQAARAQPQEAPLVSSATQLQPEAAGTVSGPAPVAITAARPRPIGVQKPPICLQIQITLHTALQIKVQVPVEVQLGIPGAGRRRGRQGCQRLLDSAAKETRLEPDLEEGELPDVPAEPTWGREERVFGWLNLAAFEALSGDGDAALVACEKALQQAAYSVQAQHHVWRELLTLAATILLPPVHKAVPDPASSEPGHPTGSGQQASGAASRARRRQGFCVLRTLVARFAKWARAGAALVPLDLPSMSVKDKRLEAILVPPAAFDDAPLAGVLARLLPVLQRDELVVVLEDIVTVAPNAPALVPVLLDVISREKQDAQFCGWALPLLAAALATAVPPPTAHLWQKAQILTALHSSAAAQELQALQAARLPHTARPKP